MANIRLGSLDFDDIKSSIKNYISTQTEFSDYNFEGSGISALINVLAYNTHYNALAANMIANEMFLDTAAKRTNVVSKAKELGYTPRSKRAADTNLTVTFSDVTNAASIGSLLLPRGTRFTTTIGDNSYTFVLKTPKIIDRSVEQSQYIYRDILTVYEGILVSETKTYNEADPTILISNIDIDTSTLVVEVSENNGVDWVEYVFPSSILTANETSKVYILQEGIDGFEIYFGDGVIGYSPSHNSLIRMTYVVTSGSDGNGASVYSLASSIQYTTGANITVVGTISSGGSNEETIQSIKLNAINQYGTQNRAVVAKDYAALAQQNFTSIKECLAWDGGDNNPPKFGKVVLCVKPMSGDVLLSSQKLAIADFLESKGVANTKVEFVDPEYIDLVVSTSVSYNMNKLEFNPYELIYIVKNAISSFATTNIFKFNSSFRYSNLVKTIDSANHAINSNQTTIKLLKNYIPNLFGPNNIKFSFSNSLKAGSFVSSTFNVSDNIYPVFLKDNGSGKIHIYYSNNGLDVVHGTNIGLIDYNSGEIQVDNLYIQTINGLQLKLIVSPLFLDVRSDKRVILNLSDDNITVEPIQDTE